MDDLMIWTQESDSALPLVHNLPAGSTAVFLTWLQPMTTLATPYAMPCVSCSSTESPILRPYLFRKEDKG